ncbi:unnamed protein product [Pylaiella littoralis]
MGFGFIQPSPPPALDQSFLSEAWGAHGAFRLAGGRRLPLMSKQIRPVRVWSAVPRPLFDFSSCAWGILHTVLYNVGRLRAPLKPTRLFRPFFVGCRVVPLKCRQELGENREHQLKI